MEESGSSKGDRENSNEAPMDLHPPAADPTAADPNQGCKGGTVVPEERPGESVDKKAVAARGGLLLISLVLVVWIGDLGKRLNFFLCCCGV